jgi:hypothetical protein
VNLLIDVLPESVVIGGKDVAINTDFRDCLRVILAYEDDELTSQEKQIITLSNLYPSVPLDLHEAMTQAKWFLDCGKDDEQTDDRHHPRVYSFSKDAEMIYAAFRQVHGIKLDTEYQLHWWKFVALFMAVMANQDTAFGSLVTLRLRVKTGKATKEEQRAAREMGELFDVPEPDTRTLEQKESLRRFDELVAAAERERNNGNP